MTREDARDKNICSGEQGEQSTEVESSHQIAHCSCARGHMASLCLYFIFFWCDLV